MSSKAESIIGAVATALTVPTMTAVPAARVYRDLNEALDTGIYPAIVLELGNEGEPERLLIGYKMRTLDVSLTVLATGANAYTSADAAVVESFNRLAANPTLGGLAFEFDEGETIRERDGAAQNVASVTKLYRFKFRTTEGSLEA
jgi:hypothetical protein